MEGKLKIINLKAENFKRLSAVDIKPQDDTVVLSGKNGVGKSSVLDAIMHTLSGGRGVPEPVRRGQAKAEVTIDLGDLKVTRSWTNDGKSKVVVQSADGMKYQTPQAILDTLIGKLTFDPVEFASMQPIQQRATLLGLVDLPFDLAEHDKQRDELVKQVTATSKELERAEAEYQAIENVPDDTPDEEISASAILDQIKAANEVIKQNNVKREELEGLHTQFSYTTKDADEVASRITELKHMLDDAQKAFQDKMAELDKFKAEEGNLAFEVEMLKDPDTSKLEATLSTIDEVNRNVRRMALNAAVYDTYVSLQAKLEKDKAALAAHNKARTDALSAAKFPVKDLSFTDDGVTLNGFPLVQISDSEKVAVSAAIGMAMNPKLYVMFIREGSLLDSSTFDSLIGLAKQHDYQLWIEEVDESGEVGIYIEDGAIVKDNYQEVSDAKTT